MANTQMLIAEAYSAFNQRDIDGALALMSENVSWPKASEGGRAVGKGKFAPTGRVSGRSLTPHVEPVEMIDREGSTTEVKVQRGDDRDAD